MKSNLVLMALLGANAIQLRSPVDIDLSDLTKDTPLDDLSKKEIQQNHDSEMMQMWSDTVDGSKESKSAAQIAKENVAVQQKNAEIQLSGAGSDVTDWAQDDTYFHRIFKKYSTPKMKADGSESNEKIIAKDDSEKALTEILMAKIDSSGDAKKGNKQVHSMMQKYFKDDWEYYDAASEGFIETTRAQTFIHKFINQVKLDDDFDDLKFKTGSS